MSSPRVTADQLRSFVERIQRLEEEGKAINDDKRDVYAEAKGSGFDVPALKAVISHLRKGADKAQEHRAIFDLYLDSFLGRSLTPELNKRTGNDPEPNARPSEKIAPTRARAENSRETVSPIRPVSVGEPASAALSCSPTGAGSVLSFPTADDIPDFLRREAPVEASA